MDVEKLKNTIKSNLVSFNLTPEEITKITEQILQDVLEIIGERD